MKQLLGVLFFCCSIATAFSQDKQKTAIPNPNKKIQIVDVSCGKCNFNMGGEECRLAVRINGKNYFVEGAAIDDFGDAHAKAGLCKAVRKAKVQGEVVGNLFKATYFKLIEEKKKPGLKVVI